MEVTYTFPEGDVNTMNKYVLTNGDSVSTACNTWKIFGKVDGGEWVMLDSQDNVEWTTSSQSLTFTLSNLNAYNSYMFQCSSVVNFDNVYYANQLDMAEWSLILV